MKFDPREDQIDRVLEFDQAEEFNFMMSATMRVPPIKSSNYKAAAVMTLSESLLRRKIDVYLVAKTGKGQYQVLGLSEGVQRDLVSLII